MSEYDAHATAKTGETTFTLQAGDPYAHVLTELWAALMGDNKPIISARFGAISQAHSTEIASGNSFGNVQTEKGKVKLAYETAERMREQRHVIDNPENNDPPNINERLLFSLREILDHVTDGGTEDEKLFSDKERDMVKRARKTVLDAEG